MDVAFVLSCTLVFIVQMILSHVGQSEAGVELVPESGRYSTGYSRGYFISTSVYSLLTVAGMVLVPIVIAREGPEHWPLLFFEVIGPAVIYFLGRECWSMQLAFDSEKIAKRSSLVNRKIEWKDVEKVKASLFFWHALELHSANTVIRISIYTRGFKSVVAHVRRFVRPEALKEVEDYLYQLERTMD